MNTKYIVWNGNLFSDQEIYVLDNGIQTSIIRVDSIDEVCPTIMNLCQNYNIHSIKISAPTHYSAPVVEELHEKAVTEYNNFNIDIEVI